MKCVDHYFLLNQCNGKGTVKQTCHTMCVLAVFIIPARACDNSLKMATHLVGFKTSLTAALF